MGDPRYDGPTDGVDTCNYFKVMAESQSILVYILIVMMYSRQTLRYIQAQVPQ
jgi:hypothetical protein